MSRRPRKEGASDSRHRVAREAASFLYFGLEKEYRQAKLKASKNLGIRVLPSNLEVALEMDRIAGETEGPARTERLVLMRSEAWEIMKVLKQYNPVLIGSVWRGNIKRGSDIDIEVYYDDPEKITAIIRDCLKIFRTERVTTNEHGKTKASFHIHAMTPTNQVAEITVRNSEEADQKKTCDTFGDKIKGLHVQELERLLKQNPTQRFLPT